VVSPVAPADPVTMELDLTSKPTLALPDSPAQLVRHLVDEHGWAMQAYDPSMMAAHRIAHGTDLPAELRDESVGHGHDFPAAVTGGQHTAKLFWLCAVMVVLGVTLSVLWGALS
jgi:hypothetical protein